MNFRSSNKLPYWEHVELPYKLMLFPFEFELSNTMQNRKLWHFFIDAELLLTYFPKETPFAMFPFNCSMATSNNFFSSELAFSNTV